MTTETIARSSRARSSIRCEMKVSCGPPSSGDVDLFIASRASLSRDRARAARPAAADRLAPPALEGSAGGGGEAKGAAGGAAGVAAVGLGDGGASAVDESAASTSRTFCSMSRVAEAIEVSISFAADWTFC
jgi:hypothetical protein